MKKNVETCRSLYYTKRLLWYIHLWYNFAFVVYDKNLKIRRSNSEMFAAVTQAALHDRRASKLYCKCVSVNLWAPCAFLVRNSGLARMKSLEYVNCECKVSYKLIQRQKESFAICVMTFAFLVLVDTALAQLTDCVLHSIIRHRYVTS